MVIDPKSLLAQVQANHRALESCPDHDFQREDRHPMPARYRCTRCGGEASLQFVSGYQQGRAHSAALPAKEGVSVTAAESDPTTSAPARQSRAEICRHGIDRNRCTACEPLARLQHR
ncbi:hypothetical protein [Azospirillum sp. BE72]|uniref:hypothetical protein n=1 Tax=Azospirillum sp. BE72 TaxID=2817776 RepID=UPI002854C66F|nr:hypothetical protein [Azospirillum sp. BE72]MDR6770392.1 hypothetical protein [Azospirillum sp. BE72]